MSNSVHDILAINPTGTTTQVALFADEDIRIEADLPHLRAELDALRVLRFEEEAFDYP